MDYIQDIVYMWGYQLSVFQTDPWRIDQEMGTDVYTSTNKSHVHGSMHFKASIFLHSFD